MTLGWQPTNNYFILISPLSPLALSGFVLPYVAILCNSWALYPSNESLVLNGNLSVSLLQAAARLGTLQHDLQVF
jgi:hypothetical protein